MMKPILITLLLTTPAFGQSMYKCPSPQPGAPAIYQQMPCSPQGGGDAVTANPIRTTGTDARINEQGQAYMQDNKERWTSQREAEIAEANRQDALDAEHRKAKAAEDQAAAQRATARAILMTGRRY
jgi:multidrug efflux pump subunit AcrA (membrane-fusion protein)